MRIEICDRNFIEDLATTPFEFDTAPTTAIPSQNCGMNRTRCSGSYSTICRFQMM